MVLHLMGGVPKWRQGSLTSVNASYDTCAWWIQGKHADDESVEVTRERKALIKAWDAKVRVYNTESERLPTLIKDCLAALTRPG